MTGCLVLKALYLERQDMVPLIIDWAQQFFKDRLNGWISDHGGWVRILQILCDWVMTSETGFRHILSFTARKGVWKARFYNVFTDVPSAASGSKFDLEQNSGPESGRARLESVEVIKIYRPSIDRLVILWSLPGFLRCYKTDFTIFCP